MTFAQNDSQRKSPATAAGDDTRAEEFNEDNMLDRRFAIAPVLDRSD
jgi:hypothetical protein